MLKMQLCIKGINYILKYIQIERVILYCNNISQYYSFYCMADQIIAALVSIKAFTKTLKNITDPKLLNGIVYIGL